MIHGHKEEGFIFYDRSADRSRKLIQLVRDVHGINRDEVRRRNTTVDRWRTESVRRKTLGLPTATGSQQIKQLTVKFIRARLSDDVQRRPISPTDFGRERVHQHIEFLDCAHRHRGHRRLSPPTLVIARSIEKKCRRAARTYAGDEVSLVHKEVA